MDARVSQFLIQPALCLVVWWVIATAIYRIWFHPLALYPGPWLAKVTDLYNVYHCFVGDRHLEFYRIHEVYGDVVRYGPNRVSIRTATALHTIYSPKANVAKSSHFRVFTRFFPSWSTQTMIDTEAFHHKEKRKVLAQALTDKSLRSMEDRMLAIVRRFSAVLKGASDGQRPIPRDIAQLASYLAFDVMGEVCFGRDFEMLQKTEHRYMLDVVSDGARCLNTVGHMQSLLNLGIHKLVFRNLLHGLQRYKEFSVLQCQRRVAEDDQRIDVFSHLLDANRTGAPLFSTNELVCESSLLIIAGSDTTSTCLAATVFYLLHNPEAQERAQAEVRAAFNHVDDIRGGAQLSGCQYLRACIDESLRLSPPVGGLMPREALAGGIEIDGHVFPAGTEVGTPCYALHHRAADFPEPFAFRPARWLAAEGAADAGQKARAAFCAWSVGPRNCVGKAMAYLELTIVLGRLLWEFDMRLPAGSRVGEGGAGMGYGRERAGEYQLWDTFASKSHGPLVEFWPRTTGA